MKIKHLFVIVLAMLGLSATVAFAQDTTTTVIPVEVQNVVLAFITKLAITHPWVATLVTLMGSARLWAKPVSSIVHQIVELSPTKRDDDLLTSFLNFFNANPVGKVLAYIIDWVTSIKIQVPNDPQPKV